MAAADQHPQPLSVSALTASIKAALEPRLSRIYVEGEISGWRTYPSGHAYFTLKDAGAQVNAVMFASSLARCRAAAELKDGAKVVVYGNVTIYPPRGSYQITVLAAKLVGAGELMQRYLELKDRLGREGLFDRSRKRQLPFLPRRIGIATSEAGAVIHDMCNVLLRRFPALEIRLCPCQVQGSAAAASVVRAIEYFNDPGTGWRADVLIVARGGGSFEDLFCFNDESLVRAVAASAVPTISAVGHETDFTLCDFAADVRAGTPSIAAEIAVPVMADLADRVAELGRAMAASLRAKGEFFAQRLDHLADALSAALAMRRERLETRLAHAADRLRLLSPYGVLERGYSLTTTPDGALVRDASALRRGDRLKTRFAAGEAESEVV